MSAPPDDCCVCFEPTDVCTPCNHRLCTTCTGRLATPVCPLCRGYLLDENDDCYWTDTDSDDDTVSILTSPNSPTSQVDWVHALDPMAMLLMHTIEDEQESNDTETVILQWLDPTHERNPLQPTDNELEAMFGPGLIIYTE